MKSRFAVSLVILAALVVLLESAPGFRPKHISWIYHGLANPRGMGLLAFALLMLVLYPGAVKCKERGLSQTAIGAGTAFVGLLFIADFALETLSGSEALGLWCVRIALIAFAAWGCFRFRPWKSAFSMRLEPASQDPRWERGTKLLLFLVGFLFFREELQTFIERPMPFKLFGDEATWYGMADALSRGGFSQAFTQGFNYQPGIPWLIALPSRLLGHYDPEWLYAYAAGLPFLMFLWIYELSRNRLALLAGLSLLAFLQIDSRDFRFYFAGTLYGEATTSILLAILMGETYPAFLSPQKSKAGPKSLLPMQALLWGALLGLCAMAKAPLSALLPLWILGFLFWLFRRSYSLRDRGLAIAILLALFSAPSLIWKWQLAVWRLPPYYNAKISEFFTSGFGLDATAKILKGFVLWRSNGATLLSAWVAMLLISWLLNQRRFFLFLLGFSLSYVGFVLFLYSTYWQTMETGSAGRYICHAVYASALLIPLAFRDLGSKREENAKNETKPNAV